MTCTGTATTRWSRSATRAPPSAPGPRRPRSTSNASSGSKTGCSRRSRRRFPFRSMPSSRPRGGALYKQYCAECHGASGGDFGGAYVGKVTPIAEIAHRSAPARFLHARAGGQPGDAVRRLSMALHAFPQDLRLRQHAARRPVAARALSAQRIGADAARPAGAGSDAPQRCSTAATICTTRCASASCRTCAEEDGKLYFKFDTRVDGNTNVGHEGKAYGTELSAGRQVRAGRISEDLLSGDAPWLHDYESRPTSRRGAFKVLLLLLLLVGAVGAYVAWDRGFREHPQPDWVTGHAGDAVQVRLPRRGERCRNSVLDLLCAAADVSRKSCRARRLRLARRAVGAGAGAAGGLHQEDHRLSARCQQLRRLPHRDVPRQAGRDADFHRRRVRGTRPTSRASSAS